MKKGFEIEKLKKPENSDDWDETKKYYEEYIYIDKYGIFDFYEDKSNLATYISDLYLYKTPIGLDFFLRSNYYFSNDFTEEKNKLDRTLEYLHLHIKRGNLKVRVFLSTNYKYNEYLKENADEFIEEIKEQYLKAGTWEGGPQDKNDFMEFWIEITLVENKWLDYKDLVKN